MQCFNELPLRDDIIFDQNIAETLFCLLLNGQRFFKLLLRNGTSRDQQIAKSHISHGTSSLSKPSFVFRIFMLLFA